MLLDGSCLLRGTLEEGCRWLRACVDDGRRILQTIEQCTWRQRHEVKCLVSKLVPG